MSLPTNNKNAVSVNVATSADVSLFPQKLWNLESTGDRAADIAAGKRLADAALDEMLGSGDPLKIKGLIQDIVKSGEWNGCTFGFVTRLSDLALVAFRQGA